MADKAISEAISELSLSQQGLRTFPPEIRTSIFTEVLRDSFKGQTPALILALRGDARLYQEALDIFFQTNTITLDKHNEWRFWTTSPAVLQSLTKVRLDLSDLCISNWGPILKTSRPVQRKREPVGEWSSFQVISHLLWNGILAATPNLEEVTIDFGEYKWRDEYAVNGVDHVDVELPQLLASLKALKRLQIETISRGLDEHRYVMIGHGWYDPCLWKNITEVMRTPRALSRVSTDLVKNGWRGEQLFFRWQKTDDSEEQYEEVKRLVEIARQHALLDPLDASEVFLMG